MIEEYLQRIEQACAIEEQRMDAAIFVAEQNAANLMAQGQQPLAVLFMQQMSTHDAARSIIRSLGGIVRELEPGVLDVLKRREEAKARSAKIQAEVAAVQGKGRIIV